MRIFITGIAGFLGSHLADRMLADGHEVHGIDDLSGGDALNVPAGAEFRKADCGDLDTVTRLMRGADVVYHTACVACEGLSVFSPNHITRNTSGITASVVSAAVRNGVKRFVYCSSMARYGKGDPPFVETAVPAPVDPYGIAKVAGEMLVKAMGNAHGMDWCIAVPHNIIGPRQRYDDPYRNVASIMANLMLQGRRPFVYGDGKQKRCFTFISDAVGPLAMMATAENVSRETINIGPDEEFVTINDLGRELAGIIGVEFDPIRLPDRPLEVKTAVCSSDKARRLLGYFTGTSFHDGLVELVDWIRQKGPKPFRYNLPLEISNHLTPETWRKRLF